MLVEKHIHEEEINYGDRSTTEGKIKKRESRISDYGC